MKLVLRDGVSEEMLEAAIYYARHEDEKLARRFLIETDEALERLTYMPSRYPKAWKEARRAFVKHFPYSIIFEIEDDQVTLLTVIHDSRDPKAWITRLSGE